MDSASDSNPSLEFTRAEVAAWVGLVAWLWISRLVVAPSGLIEWDSANYALALRSFDIAQHQPHPPGNPLFVLLLQLCRWAPGDSGPFLVANAILGTVMVVGLGWILRPEIGRRGTWTTAALLTCCAPVWFQGASSTAYVAEGAASVIAGAVAAGVARRRGSLPVLAIALAVAVGIRPNIAVAALPLVMVCGLLAWPGWRAALGAWLIFAVGCAAWLLPMIALGGGLAKYRLASESLWVWQVSLGSVFGTGEIVNANAWSLALYLFDALSVLWVMMGIDLTIAVVRRKLDWKALMFLLLWLAPGALFYALHHLPKSGYVLSLFPPCFAATALLARDAHRGLSGTARKVSMGFHGLMAGGWLAVNLYGFAYSVPFDLLRWRDAPIAIPQPVILGSDYGRIALQYRAWPHQHTSQLLDQLDDENDLALFLFGSHELFRVQMYNRPGQWMIATSLDHSSWLEMRGGVATPTFGELQDVVLRPPEQGLSSAEPSRVRRLGPTLQIARPGRAMDIQLDRVPGRVLAFVPCPPCALEPIEEGANPVGKPIGGGWSVFEITGQSPR